MGKELKLSRILSNIDLNKDIDAIRLYTHWCRIVYRKFEKLNPKEHFHLFWEFHLCLSGSATISIDGVQHVLSENTWVFLCPKSKHRFVSVTQDYSEFVWGFNIEDKDEINENLNNFYKSAKEFDADKEFIDSITLILENVEKMQFGYYNLIANTLYHIFLILVRNAGIKNNATHHKVRNNEIDVIRKYICDNLSSDVSIEDVSLFLGVSKNSIDDTLKKECDKTFVQFKREIKSHAICELLRETDRTMEEIAEAIGFSDRYSMGKFFKTWEYQTT